MRQKLLLSLSLAFALTAGLPQVAMAQIEPVALAAPARPHLGYTPGTREVSFSDAVKEY